MSDAVQPVHITTIFLGFALIQSLRIEQILLIQNADATVGRVGRTINAKRRFEELDTGYAERQNYRTAIYHRPVEM